VPEIAEKGMNSSGNQSFPERLALADSSRGRGPKRAWSCPTSSIILIFTVCAVFIAELLVMFVSPTFGTLSPLDVALLDALLLTLVLFPVFLRCFLRPYRERLRQLHCAEETLNVEHSFLQSVIDGVIDPIMVIDLECRILLMNQAARLYLPPGEGDGEGLRCHQVSHRSDQPCRGEDHPCPLEEVLRTGSEAIVVHQHRLADGELRSYELKASPLRDASGKVAGIIESSRDITERLHAESQLRRKEARLKHLAHHDPLTQLPNRLLLRDRLEQALHKAERRKRQAALLFLDLDRFKTINDSIGHDVGDQLLREVAQRLSGCVRKSDTLARLGGDEFLVVVEEFQKFTDLATVAESILGTLARPFNIRNHELYVTASIGISVYPADGMDSEGLLRCADVAMYRSKERGRNTYQFYTPDMNARAHERLLLEGDLRRALDQEQFVLHYQPQVELPSGRLIGVEALLRWRHSKRGLVPPADFIPLAEETGLIVPIGEWVLRQACRQGRAWQESGLAPVRMAVNISGRQFRQPNFVDTVDEILGETGLDPRWLELEITESVIMGDVEESIMTLTDLKVRDIHLAVDDFGTGYSSLSYLKRFPISRLKVDRSFVRDVTSDPNDAAIAGSIVALGRSMGLDVVAEGIETPEQLAFMKERGCQQGQGFLFSRPLPAEQIESFLRREQSGEQGTFFPEETGGAATRGRRVGEMMPVEGCRVDKK